MKAAELKLPKAITYLNHTSFKACDYALIAKKYHEGDGVARNIDLAIRFYEKAAEQGNLSAALVLAQFHQKPEKKGARINTEKAFSSHLKAAQLGHHDSLPVLDRLAEHTNAKNQMKLSQLYGSFFHHQEKEAYWRSKATESAHFELMKTDAPKTIRRCN